MQNSIHFDLFVNSYLATAVWATCDVDECQEFTLLAIDAAKVHCMNFLALCRENGIENKIIYSFAGEELPMLAAHDFFLTRNGHGAGFWDKEDIYGEELATKFTEIV